MRLVFLFLFLCVIVFSAQSQNDCGLATKITEVVNTYHLQPQKIDDSLSVRIFSELFYQLDPAREIFSREDVGQLSSFRFTIDDQINSGKCDFLKAYENLYLKKIERTRNFIDSALQKPLLYSQQEFYDPINAFSDDFKTENVRKKQILVRLRYQIMNMSYLKVKQAEAAIDMNAFTKAEPESRLRVKNKEISLLKKSVADHQKESMSHVFYKTIALTYDPHTEYFSKETIKEFEAAISTQEFSFGFDIEQTPIGEIKIRKLTPGGPAWSTNELHAGDVLLEIQGKEIYDLLDYDDEEVIELLQDPLLSEVKIKVRKSNGEVKQVSLVKAKMENEDNIISSFLLKGEKKIGYISLPGFFTDIESTAAANGSANAVAKEILHLKSENMEGLILDLRFNGGGSTQEAIELAGIFIDVGPLVIIQEKDQTVILKDVNRGMAYTGPLMIMINNGSASASELVAGAMQDYKRALIVGSPSFGKATGQAVFPINKSDEENGFAKVTMERLFRVDGSSLQQKGITPDISMPDLVTLMKMSEGSLHYALSSSPIAKKGYYTPQAGYPVSVLKELSKKRVEASEDFKSIVQLSQLFTSAIPLEKNAFIQFSNTVEKELSSMDESHVKLFEVLNTKMNKSLLEVDQYHQEINQQSKEAVERSIYIREAYQIMNDFINNKKP